MSQIFDGYINDAVEVCSTNLLKANEIDEDTHKDNLMYLRLIQKLPLEALEVLFKKVKTRCEDMEMEDDTGDEDDDEHEDESDDEGKTNISFRYRFLFIRTKYIRT